MEKEIKVGIPENLTINGVTYAVKDCPELQKFIQDVAKVEKSKLYTQISDLRERMDALSKVNVSGDPLNISELVSSLKETFITKDDFKTTIQQVVKETVQPVLNATEESRKNELKQYREKLISENAATCIPDLVKGETKEELDASLQESIRLRAAYPANPPAGKTNDPLVKAQEKSLETPTPMAAPAPQETPAVPATPRRPSPEVNGSPNIKSMTASEFASQRDSLERQLRSMYGE